MPLFPTRQLPELLLRNTGRKPFQARQDLRHILSFDNISFRSPNQGLNLEQALTTQMIPQSLLDLFQNLFQKPVIFLPLGFRLWGYDFVNKIHLYQLLHRNPLTHNQGLVRQTDSHSLHECATGAPLGHQPETGEWS